MHAQSCPTLCNSMDCSLPGSSVHGILQARILEWVAISSSRESFWPRDRTCVSCISCVGRQILYHWATWETHKMLYNLPPPPQIIIPFVCSLVPLGKRNVVWSLFQDVRQCSYLVNSMFRTLCSLMSTTLLFCTAFPRSLEEWFRDADRSLI